MLPQFNKLWRRRILNRFNRKYNFLRQPANGTRRSLKCTLSRRLLDSGRSEAFFILTLIIVVVIVILYLNGITASDVKYHIGLGPSTIMSLSTLDHLEDVNFPEDSKHHIKNGDTVVWKVDGFNQYMDQIKNNSDVLGIFGKLPSGKKVDVQGSGLWLFKNVPSSLSHGNLNTKTSGLTPSIRAFRIAEHVLAKYSQEDIEMAVAVKSYVDGEATLVVKYEDISGKHVHTDHIEHGKFQNKGFCFLILDVPFDKRINTVA